MIKFFNSKISGAVIKPIVADNDEAIYHYLVWRAHQPCLAHSAYERGARGMAGQCTCLLGIRLMERPLKSPWS